MKKQLIYSIITVFLIMIIIIGSTYAFFTSTAKANNNAAANSKNFEVIYTGGGQNLSGSLKPCAKKEDGINTTVNIKMAQNSALARATLYINIEKITSNLAVEGFVWEVYGTDPNGTQVYYNKGNFAGTNDTDKNTVNIVENYQLSYENTSFTVYLWVDRSKVDNGILNSEFKGSLGAKTENFTGATVG